MFSGCNTVLQFFRSDALHTAGYLKFYSSATVSTAKTYLLSNVGTVLSANATGKLQSH